MRAAEKAAFARGVPVEALMDQAGRGIAHAVEQFFPAAGRCVVLPASSYAGMPRGRAMSPQRGWTSSSRTGLPQRLHELPVKNLSERHPRSAKIKGSLIILDVLLGVGTAPASRASPQRSAGDHRRRREQNALFAWSFNRPRLIRVNQPRGMCKAISPSHRLRQTRLSRTPPLICGRSRFSST